MNAAAAHLVHRGDLVVTAGFVRLEEAEARNRRPRVVFVDEQNRPRETRSGRAGLATSQGRRTGWASASGREA